MKYGLSVMFRKWFQLVINLVVSHFALLMVTEAAIVPPPWSNPITNPCANMSGGWQLLYWPPLNKCFKIFTIGYPCPESMELSPTVLTRKLSREQNVPPAECRCPPGTALDVRTNKCYKLFERGPCEFGQYFEPIVVTENNKRNGNRLGTCRNPPQCPEDMTFWPNDGKCYEQFKRGPCPKGKLLIDFENGYGECKCEGTGLLKKYYYELEQTCHEHYTKGPCTTPGYLFLPNGKCDCHIYLPHYHKEHRMCFELNTPGPCPFGHIFKIPENANNSEKIINVQAECQCKDDFVKWSDGNCYRLYTRGPCKSNEFLISSTRCVQNFCNKAQLYFPEEGTCYRIGSQGPCPQQQVVVFDYTARPSVEGISYKGICGCSGIIKDLEQKCLYSEPEKILNECSSNSGMVRLNDTCYKLYTQGPCEADQWLIPLKNALNHGRQKLKNAAKCVCRQNSTESDTGTDETETNTQSQCSAPNVSLARWFLELLG